MDIFMVNLNGISAKEGDEVIVFDKKNNLEDLQMLLEIIMKS